LAEEQKLKDQIRRASQKDAEVLEGLNDLKFKGLRKMLDGTFEWVHQNIRLAPNDVPEGLWQVVSQDLITGLPNIKGFNAIATFVDCYRKQVHVVPTTDKVDSDGIAEIHYCNIF
jgi:hypothetical protein